MRKLFRVIKMDVSKELEENPLVLRYKIEQRYTILFFIHWWGTPSFAPPHAFATEREAELCVWHKYPNAGIRYH